MSMTIGPRMTPMSTGMPRAWLAGETAGTQLEVFSGESVQVTAGMAFGTESVDSAVEGDLRRDDEIGVLCAGAFKLPAPEMPEELKG